MIEYHRLSPEFFDLIARTHGHPGTAKLLRRFRFSRALLLLSRLVADDAAVGDTVEPLTQAQLARPDVVEAVLTYPWVSVWTANACRIGWRASDRERLRAVVAATCIRAGIAHAAPVVLPDQYGQVLLPTLGILHRSAATAARVTPRELSGPRWVELYRVSTGDTGHRLSIVLDDLDPYRQCHGSPASTRLGRRIRRRWRERLVNAWHLLEVHAPDRCAELAAGVTSIVPLLGGANSPQLSATHADAYGGFAATFPDTAADMAAAMIHEYQHSKLNAVQGIITLYDDGDPNTYFAPWRSDPRPLGALLQGAYAFTAVADFWHALRSHPDLEDRATREFAAMRAQVNRALAALTTSTALTVAGRRFVSGLAESISSLMRSEVPRAVDQWAKQRLSSLERSWRQRHGGTGPFVFTDERRGAHTPAVTRLERRTAR